MSEIRTDPITGRVVIIAPERRQWRRPPREGEVPLGERCPFCEGHEADAGAEILAWRPPGSPANGPGWQLRVVPNRIPALRVEERAGALSDGLFRALGGVGANEVFIESPRHDARWSSMTVDEVARVLWAWRERLRDLRRDPRLRAFVVVRGEGALAGATLAHPHSQLLALPVIPEWLDAELTRARAHHATTGQCLACDVIAAERAETVRVVAEGESTVVVAPFAARVPFESWLLPRAHQAQFDDISDAALREAAALLQRHAARLQAELEGPAVLTRLITAPVGNEGVHGHWRIEVAPRFAVDSALAWDGGVAINTVTPEEAARVLRQRSDSGRA